MNIDFTCTKLENIKYKDYLIRIIFIVLDASFYQKSPKIFNL